MKELIPTDHAASSSVTEGTVRWAPNDAYAQAHGNKPEYAGRVRQVGPNILPVRGSIHSYYTLSQARSQNTENSMVSQMTDRIKELEAEWAQHRAQMDEMLATQREMAKYIEEQKAQMATKDAMVDLRFRQLEAMMQLTSRSAPKVTQHRTLPDRGNAIFVLFLFFLC
jgi:hypothetical protein